MPIVQVVTFPSAVDRLLGSPGSALVREMDRLGLKIESDAKRNASGRPGPNVRTGRLRSSIGHHVESGNPPELFITVGAEYGLYLEKGWTTSRGLSVRYPFLEPAVQSAGGGFGALTM